MYLQLEYQIIGEGLFRIYSFIFLRRENYFNVHFIDKYEYHLCRCFVPECDDALHPVFDEPWVDRAVPGSVDSYGHFTPEQCLRFKPANNGTYQPLRKASPQCSKVFDLHVSETCDRWVFDKYDDKTIVQEWGITCKDNQWLLALIGTCHFTGIVIGSAAAGVLADKYDPDYLFFTPHAELNLSHSDKVTDEKLFSFYRLCLWP